MLPACARAVRRARRRRCDANRVSSGRPEHGYSNPDVLSLLAAVFANGDNDDRRHVCGSRRARCSRARVDVTVFWQGTLFVQVVVVHSNEVRCCDTRITRFPNCKFAISRIRNVMCEVEN